jgi:hypothetical protein
MEASGANVIWTDWTAATFGASGAASGTISSLGGPVSVSYSGEVAGPTQVAGGINYWAVNAPFLSGVVSNEPPASDIITLSGGIGVTSTLTFSRPLRNPVMAILSLGAPPLAVDYDFDQPFDVLSFGPGHWGGPGTLTELAGDVLRGVEGHGVIRFQGSITSISWTAGPREIWHGFTIGIVPEPSSVVLLLVAALPIVMRRAR